MSIYELTKEQMQTLKETYLIHRYDEKGLPTYMSELADVDNLIPDEVIFAGYSGIDFVEDDFMGGNNL